MDLGLVLSRIRYFLIAVLMLSMACLAVILYASFLAVFPIVANASIYCVCSVWLVGSGGMWTFKGVSNVILSGWFLKLRVGVVTCYVDCFADVVMCFKVRFPYFLLLSREESTL
jgi:hypothetical protein